VYIGIGRPDLRLKLLILRTIPTVIAFIVVVRWGILAVAAVYVVSAYLLMSLDLIALRKLIGLSWTRYVANFVPAALASAVMVLATVVVMQVPMPELATVVASIVVGSAIYVLSLYLIAPALARELWSKVALIFDRSRLRD